MIKRYDLYILKRYLSTVLVSLVAMIFVYVLIDLFDHLNKFLDAKTPLIGYVILYLLKIPIIVSQIFPAIVFMSVLFTFGVLNKYNEILSLITSGISFYRISIPILILGIFFSFAHFSFSEFLLPHAARLYQKAEKKYMNKKRKVKRGKNDIAYQEGNNVVFIKSFSNKNSTAYGVSIQHIVNAKIRYRIDSDKMVYRDSIWVLLGNKRREFNDGNISYSEPDKIFMKFDFTPKELKDIELKPRELGYFELKEFIVKKEAIGIDMTKWKVELLSKVAYSSINFVMLLIALPLSAGRVRSSASVNFGLSVLTAFTLYLIIIMFKNWGMVGDIPPIIAAWSPNIIFTGVAAYLFIKLRS
ncbi:MAG: hypothetical protein CR982_01495 [Candidatus Cloacimonadota bacterium]|nr:MAG: hypothetical protein CR982_01495 [Candidatus Cloacimonadota bacterium]PIE77987.1 MAG: hypothetical protein CSA15_10155 [Candidatus Delongbacteria bacterium]